MTNAEYRCLRLATTFALYKREDFANWFLGGFVVGLLFRAVIG